LTLTNQQPWTYLHRFTKLHWSFLPTHVATKWTTTLDFT